MPKTRLAMSVGSGLVIFLLFFGNSLLEELSGGDWVGVAFWLILGIAFAAMDRAGTNHRRTPSRKDG